MFKRYPVEKPVCPNILNEPVKFHTSQRTAKNRLLKGAMSERLGSWIDGNFEKTGIPTEQYINLYDKFGHGGFGTILTGNIMIDIDHLEGAGNVIIEESINTPERRQAFRQVSQAAKVDGSLIIGQISHCGSQTTTLFNPHPFSASDIQVDSKKVGMEFGKPIPLSIDDIHTLVISKFVYASRYLYETGFDGVEIHGANGFLLSQFLSPKTNKRTDEYGGSKENRIRIVLEIYQAIRDAIPPETGFIVGIKMNSVEFENDGLNVEEAAWMCQEFERIGFDFVELSGGNFENPGLDSCKNISTKKREGYFSEFARQIKPSIPHTTVFITGGFRTSPGMIAAIKAGFADGIGLSRPAAAEPDIAKKILKLNIQSATLNVIEDTRMQIMAAATQLVQAGKWALAKSHQEPTFGLLDTSNPRETDHFLEKFIKHYEEKGKEMAEGKIVNMAFDLPILV